MKIIKRFTAIFLAAVVFVTSCNPLDIYAMENEELKESEHTHNYIYEIIDADTHSVSCEGCDYTETAIHTFEEGECICGLVTVEEKEIEEVENQIIVENLIEEAEKEEEKAVYTVNFYDHEDIIFSCDVEEGNTFALPDMSNDETFIEWQLNGTVFDNENYVVTDNIDIIGVFKETKEEVVDNQEAFYVEEIDGYKVSVTGNIPEDCYVTVEKINDRTLENSINQTLDSEETFVAYATFDINIYDANGEKWQPMDYDEVVSIKIEEIESKEEVKEEALEGLFTLEYDEEGNVTNVIPVNIDEAEPTVYRVSDGYVDALDINSGVSGDNESIEVVECKTEHFSTFSYGGKTYDTTASAYPFRAGENIKVYPFPSDSLLAFVGTGDMTASSEDALWNQYKDSVFNIYIDENITSLSEYMLADFEYISSNISLPSGLTSIGDYAFYNCTNLALTGELPSGLTSIGEYAFSGCAKLALTGSLPSGLTSIGNDAFYLCTNLAFTGELPSGLMSIGNATFQACSNLALTGSLPSSLTSIGGSAFRGCTNLALTGSLPSSLTSIGTFAFDGCDLEKTHFDKNYSSATITSDTCIPTSYTVTDTFTDGKKADVVTTKYGFVRRTTTEASTAPTYEGYTLKTDCIDTTITIGATDADRLSLTRVYESARTKVFTYKGKDYYDTDATTTYTAGANVIAYWYADDGVLGFVGTGDMNNWTDNSTPWYSIKSNITDVYLSDEITSIGSSAFYSCKNLALTSGLPASLTTIGNYAFYYCTNLALTGSLPSSLTSIGVSAFNNCGNLAFAGSLPSDLTSIGESAFSECNNLALSGSLPSGLTSIEGFSFYNCEKLALSGSLPRSLTSIGSCAFENCSTLALTGDIPINVSSISTSAFRNVDASKTHFDKNLSSISITSSMYVPTSYTVTDTFTDGEKADVITTKYGFVGNTTSEAGTAPTYEGYTLKTDCADATITIGAQDSGRLSLTRIYELNKSFSVRLPASIEVTNSKQDAKHYSDFNIEAKGNKSMVKVAFPTEFTLTGENTNETFDLSVDIQECIFKPSLSPEDINSSGKAYNSYTEEAYSTISNTVMSNNDPSSVDTYKGLLTVVITSED